MAEPMSLLRHIDVRVLDSEQQLFRISHAREDVAFLECLHSRYELQRPPRGPEHRAAVIHMALSMFDSREIARQLAVRVPKLGGHIATVELRPDLGASPRPEGRLIGRVWGRPAQLEPCIVDVEQAGA